MSSSIENLRRLTEKLKRLIDDIQNQYESFIDSNQLYKEGKVNERDFFSSIGDYLLATSTMNFLAIQVIFEMKSTIEKDMSKKNATQEVPASPSNQTVFGTSGLAGTGETSSAGEYTMPKPQQQSKQQEQPAYKRPNLETRSSNVKSSEKTLTNKHCIVCGAAIPRQARFCSKCGKSQ
jgi:ribosomal protein L40E